MKNKECDLPMIGRERLRSTSSRRAYEASLVDGRVGHCGLGEGLVPGRELSVHKMLTGQSQ